MVSWRDELEVEYHLVLGEAGVGEEGEQYWWWFGGIDGQTRVNPRLYTKGCWIGLIFGLGVCVGWVVGFGLDLNK